MSTATPAPRRRLTTVARDPRVWRQAFCIGLPVGLLQAGLNQGDHWYHHHVDSVVVFKTILSPLLSFTVAFLSSALSAESSPSSDTSSA